MRLLMIAVALLGLLLAALGGCESSAVSASSGDADSDSDSDADTDSDTDTDVPIEYPEATNHFMNPNGLMTGPISPPPEDVFGEELDDGDDDWDEDDDWEEDRDAGEPEEDL